MIPDLILERYLPKLRRYKKNELVFTEGGKASFYYQIKEGDVKMFNITEDGKEFVQGYFTNNTSFGEPPLFSNSKYPANALCLSDCSIYIVPKETFFQLLKEHTDIHLKFTELICKRMVYKAKIAKEVSIYPPEHRILTLLNHLKETAKVTTDFEVNLTRQQISELTGLRVETVIRSIKKLEKLKKLYIKERKVFL
ncbi:Crp/Fnr family transcriptional regulator [Mariniflexile sp. AS56]|uniref:Crp/Fnr family transcriptional regulator n=1 Tax=Mariniflexile sp. AS56 TaxID=3063957 RepID=UPI0026F2B71A|nr:Crp/Fnr family transcriptional regulator [Mariniflexile sp. AS56]MDO7173233.1 Crp/Fnr family transcriptional regulator [Mariniflexile sp. AS56]